MTTLKDSFLGDLDSLSDYEDDHINTTHQQELVVQEDHDLNSISKLHSSKTFINVMQKVQETRGIVLDDAADADSDDLGYLLINDSNALSIEIDDEIARLHKFIFDKYTLKFRGLDSLVPHPVDYARVVKRIGNEIDLSNVHLGDLLPSKHCLIVSLAAVSANAKPLPENVLQTTLEACDRVIALDSAKQKLLEFLETRMRYIAPNLSSVVGTAVGAKLICSAGGLSRLVQMSDVHLLGSRKRNLAGFSPELRLGYIAESEIFRNTPPAHRNQARKLLSKKSLLAARADFSREFRTGAYGTGLHDEICTKLTKSQEPSTARRSIALPVPDEKTKKRRGGERSRKRKESYATTEVSKLVNRMKFGEPEESSLGDGIGVGYGMLGHAGSGKLRSFLGQKRPADKCAKVTKKLKQISHLGRSGTCSGLMSSLAFTPVQGIELLNPQANVDAAGGMRTTYFSESGTFSRIRRS